MWRSADSTMPFGGGSVVLRQQILLQRAAVDADADRDALVLGDVDDLLDERLAPMLPGFSRSPSTPCSSAMRASL